MYIDVNIYDLILLKNSKPADTILCNDTGLLQNNHKEDKMFKNEEGFSLLELSVAAGIAVVLAATAVVAISGQTAKASDGASAVTADNGEVEDALAAAH